MKSRRALVNLLAICGTCLSSTTALAQRNDDFNLLSLLSVTRPTADATVPGQPSGVRAAYSPVGGYVRFWVERRPDRPISEQVWEPRPRYPNERRDWLARLFVGRTYSRILQAQLVITRSNTVTESVTLASASHGSGRQGETWSSDLGQNNFLTPYVRVDQGSTAAIHVSLSASTDVDSSITRNLLTIVQAGARAVAPVGSPLVTSLSADRVNQASNFLDRSISQLFHENIAESSQVDLPVDYWTSDSPLVDVQAYFPSSRHVWGAPASIGVWHIRVTEPIVSIFSDVPLHRGGQQHTPAACDGTQPHAAADSKATRRSRAPRLGASTPVSASNPPPALDGADLQACIAFVGLVPAHVLGLPLLEHQTLGSYLRGDDAINAAIQRYQTDRAQAHESQQNNDRVTAAALEICNLISERAERLGLNPYDTAAAVWAFALMGLQSDLGVKVWSSASCPASELANQVRLQFPASASSAPTIPTPSTNN